MQENTRKVPSRFSLPKLFLALKITRSQLPEEGSYSCLIRLEIDDIDRSLLQRFASWVSSAQRVLWSFTNADGDGISSAL